MVASHTIELRVVIIANMNSKRRVNPGETEVICFRSWAANACMARRIISLFCPAFHAKIIPACAPIIRISHSYALCQLSCWVYSTILSSNAPSSTRVRIVVADHSVPHRQPRGASEVKVPRTRAGFCTDRTRASPVNHCDLPTSWKTLFYLGLQQKAPESLPHQTHGGATIARRPLAARAALPSHRAEPSVVVLADRSVARCDAKQIWPTSTRFWPDRSCPVSPRPVVVRPSCVDHQGGGRVCSCFSGDP